MSNKKILVLVHGFLSGKDYWRKQAILGDYADIITAELPGYGHRFNETVCSSINEFAKSVIKQINRQTTTNFDLLGHSMGGMIAQEVVRLIPKRVDKLVLFGTGPIGDIPNRFEPIDESLLKANINSYQSEMEKAVASWFLNYAENADYNEAIEMAKLANFEAYCGGLNAMKEWNGVKHLNEIQQNTLIIWGNKDRTYDITQQQLFNDNIENSQIITVEDSAHNTHLEKADEFNTFVKEFLYN